MSSRRLHVTASITAVVTASMTTVVTASLATSMTSRSRQLATLLLVSLVSACSKGATPEASPAAAAPSDSQDMKGMPGMKSMPGMDDMAARPVNEAADGSRGDEGAVTFTSVQVRNGGVRWQPVVMASAQATATVPGVLAPNEDRTARLGSPASGRVLTVRVSPGDRVTRGQVLVTIASPEAGVAQADLSKATAAVTAARAQATYATAARERAERLLALKAIARQDHDRTIADDAQAQAMLTQANAELRRARSTAAQLGGDATVTGDIAVRAPLAGVVLSRTAMPGTVVESGAPLVVVTDPASLWLTVDAPESMTGVFRRGGTMRFAVPAFSGESFTARIDAVGAGLDADTRTLPVRALVSNAAASVTNGRLKAGMLASVTVAGGASTPAVLLPEDAIQLLSDRTVVFIATPDGAGGTKFTVRVVETGVRTGGQVAVTRGLRAGDVVVIAGAFRVKSQLQNGSMPEMEM